MEITQNIKQKTKNFQFLILSCLLILAVLVPWWPLAVAAVAFATLSGNFLFALFFALAVDILWGEPTNALRFLYFPLAVFTLLLAVSRALAWKYFFDRRLPRKL
ncbi:hypothetical protein A2852_02170 [Candidatus Adlerbacteria bacterium RIFCSPHIGHO2_01_FULL_54_23]|uniref:Uncharacterized protein n=3 Tax=Candidatus Adleribacteriota TaxID=1752736 RepID=A0A1F4Y0P4_9BACT|nr:MAG: hypothetical protein UY83_C0002G0092 [Candidatus Adlerbacteria bacterium GW2011_GWA1_54_10]KKW37924.1 MAG: hypothetical protein UY86_C0002G0021 [Candidatus Adlerbacteria bacterium GW2011_GWB1_54_7]OGC78535.1 MAG: hypothetical protein A2852_02170 [Candidatus Adlerbacteria bacterium RIFCSPHIGHO2_01_FULL_54_23]OGC87545.1 MAG: hypothetical protein A3B33_01365 [Candidatus Adlerbacteria bacterium RIFCSPLOWO2_01_FULL_54_16]